MRQTPIIEQFEKDQMRNAYPDIQPGKEVSIEIKISEGNKQRIQTFSGLVISRKNKGICSSVKVRRSLYGETLERTFFLHNPDIQSIVVKKEFKRRQAKLYYLRDLSGKAANLTVLPKSRKN